MTDGDTKSGKKRAAAKRKAEGGEAAPAPAQPKAAAKPKAKAAASPEAAEPKAKAKAKAKAVAEPAEAVATPEPKAKAKAKAKGKAAPAPAEAPKSKAAAKGRAKKKDEEDEEPVKKKEDEIVNWVMDDGSGGDWEVAGNDKKKKEDEKRKKKDVHNQQFVGGLANTNQKVIPGMRLAQDDKAGAGTSQSVAADIARILAIKGEPVAGEVQKAEGPPDCTAIVDVPERRIGIVIGPAGNTIQMIKTKCGVKTINTDGGHVTCQTEQGSEAGIRVVVTGPREAVNKAECAIQEIAEKGYCSLAYEDFSENFVMVHPRSFPDLIGKKGVVVQEIKKQLKVEVTFPPVPENATKKYKVGLAGDHANVEKAKSTINNILMYGHDEVTHPGMVHAEIEAEPWMFPILIGPKGSSLRNIETVFKIRLFIPRETSANQNIVLMGEPNGVERAKVSIEGRLWNDKEGKKTGDNGDFWGGEDEDIEDWMRPYMYKRR